MMKIISIVFISFLLSCSAVVNIPGKYGGNSNPDYLSLNRDSTFEYKYNAFHAKEYSEGKWLYNNRNKIFLRSFIQSKTIPLLIEKNNVKGNPEFELSFDTIHDLGKYKCAVFINDTLYSLTKDLWIVPTELTVKGFEKELNPNDIFFRYISCDSLRSFKVKSPIKSIFFKIIKFEDNSTYLTGQLETEKYVFQSDHDEYTKIKISFDENLFNYKVFKNERIKVKKRGVYMYNKNNKNWWFMQRL